MVVQRCDVLIGRAPLHARITEAFSITATHTQLPLPCPSDVDAHRERLASDHRAAVAQRSAASMGREGKGKADGQAGLREQGSAKKKRKGNLYEIAQ